MISEAMKEKVVVITGASKGLGRELAISFAKSGAIVIGNYKSDETHANKTESLLKEINSKSCMIKADITDRNEVLEMYKVVNNKYKKIDVLINNAGKNDDDFVLFLSEERWDNVIDTNLKGTFLCSKYFGKKMIQDKRGKIINIASLKGQLGSEGQTNYAASKAGIIALTKSMAKEMGKMNVSVNAICPGYIKTDLNRTNSYKCKIAEEMSALKIEFGLEDFVNFVVFIASDYVQGISGQVFNIDSRIM